MAKFSEIGKGIPEPHYTGLHTCMFCGANFTRGGSWAGHPHHVGACGACADQLMAFLIDTLRDTMGLDLLSHEEQLEYIKNIAENRLFKDAARRSSTK